MNSKVYLMPSFQEGDKFDKLIPNNETLLAIYVCQHKILFKQEKGIMIALIF